MNWFLIGLVVWMFCTTIAVILIAIAVKTLAKILKETYEKK